ncbi:hypothetical protein KKC65_03310 [Patescibacteria group bacterium]|nr:hypothetical protein [Patescibacteria group bacterium]
MTRKTRIWCGWSNAVLSIIAMIIFAERISGEPKDIDVKIVIFTFLFAVVMMALMWCWWIPIGYDPVVDFFKK